ncbi:peptidoglycan DD-metalloendopeptidase family protein [Rhizobium paknamense]|uniref:Murein DD-endopeptidase MepM/ murein hydrolase activator NlpD n=1 Tax=Rhizobium paknamense TaxID=1206817 RepID=A0ABU0IG21_9HYPH|nr:peptidoglycan DD-metalloendopeptidase family protein [Rhizobium paknamense]MDQ0457210.1 murein DD-endopeptidase MepM/ murein hydrolase activator NlpD [Rhizobium paknamense]
MRQRQSQKSGMPIAHMVWVGLMASVATGCSSDSSRFAGVFSNTDSMQTASTGSAGSLNTPPPVPEADVDGGNGGGYGGGGYNAAPASGGYNSRPQAAAQPYPSQQTYSPARRASSPLSVQKSELAPPSGASATSGPISSRGKQVASVQPSAQAFPAHAAPQPALADEDGGMAAAPQAQPPMKSSNGWSTANAPRVVLKPGESIATLSQRYGVPEKEIVKANNLSSAGAARPGQSILIPTFGARSTPARTAAAEGSLLPPGQSPTLPHQQEEKLAVLPNNPKLRDKAGSDLAVANAKNAAGDGKTPPTGGYVVKPGDSLAKIAKAHGVSVDQLKAANGLNGQSVRVGQTLSIPAGGQAEPVSTAAAPVKAEPAKVAAAAPAAQAPAPAAQAQATKSVTEVASADPGAAAPEATGIGKYRWPVRGAVVAGFGANVAGKRNDGIDISVPTGTPVKAAENGVVIYAGNGLKELGNTVLVRHDDGTVTVYGHADAISVQRGQKVQRGQQLATSGMSGNASQPTLHFEVRKDATPVNPMTFLE